LCESDESASSCPADCGGLIVCGDGVCEDTETTATCPSDCPSVEIPETTVSEEEKIPTSDVSFLAKGILDLSTDSRGSFSAVADTQVSIVISDDHILKEIETTYLTIGSETYILSYLNGAYRADVTMPGTSTRHALSVVIQYADGSVQTLSFIANLTSSGLIYEKISDINSPISEAVVTLYVLQENNWLAWDGSPWNQFNPITTKADGNFIWYVENGSYKISVTKAGYQDTDSGEITVNNNIVNSRLEIKTIEEAPVFDTITETTEKIMESLGVVVQNLSETVQTVRESPAAQTSTSVAAPIIATTAVIATAVLASSFNLLPFLQLLFTSPLLLWNRRKRKTYGVVYHSLLKTPVDLAMVRLFRMPENKLIKSRVTDKEGRFFFLAQPGSYRLEVNKLGFSYPSKILSEIKDDAVYLDVYHGETITVNEKDIVITPNVPLDPTTGEKLQTPAGIKHKKLLQQTQKYVAVVGVVIAVLVFFVQVTIWSAALLFLQIVVYLLVRRLATPKKPKSWGIVYDKTTNRPLSNVVIRIFEPKYQKLLESAVTDSKGRYTFLLGPNEYHSTYEKGGYQSQETKIDYTNEKDIKELAKDIELEPENKK
ncbi:TPA: hypothetical protein DEA21_03765, partial [Candidatus Uhrbacteria bacterium]|nr:hypothetical protein [Candidatus Uhrbacteria bacterium]